MLEQRLAAAQAALHRYGRHHANCLVLTKRVKRHRDCTCGLVVARHEADPDNPRYRDCKLCQRQEKATGDLQQRLAAAHDWLGVTGHRRVETIKNTLGDKALEFERRWSRVGREQAIAELPAHQRDIIAAAVREWEAAHAEWCALHEEAGDREFKRFVPNILQSLRDAGGALGFSMLNQAIKGHEYQFTIDRLQSLESVEVRRVSGGHRIYLRGIS